MTRLAALEGGPLTWRRVFPTLPRPEILKQAAHHAIADDLNQYSITWGAKPFRDAIAAKYRALLRDWRFDPEREITVCCGATEGMIAAMLALIEPRRRGRDLRALLRKLLSRFAAVAAPRAASDAAAARLDVSIRDELRRAFNHAPRPSSSTRPTIRPVASSRARNCNSSPISARSSTRSPSPTKSTSTLSTTAHCTCPSCRCPAMRDRSILVNSMSKTYSVTGWRVGWVLAPPDLTDSIRKVHDFLTVGAATPLQQAGVTALGCPTNTIATWQGSTRASAITSSRRSKPPGFAVPCRAAHTT